MKENAERQFKKKINFKNLKAKQIAIKIIMIKIHINTNWHYTFNF
jgi:hypothetical protein